LVATIGRPNIEAIAEGIHQLADPALRHVVAPAGPQRHVERAVEPARERDQPGAMPLEVLGRHARGVAERHVEIAAANEPHEVAVALLGLGEQHDVLRALAGLQRGCAGGRIGRLEADGELQAGDGLDALARELLGKLERAEQIVGVGERESRLMIRLGEVEQARDTQRAFEQRIGGVHVQMHESDIGFGRHGGGLSAVSPRCRASRPARRCDVMPNLWTAGGPAGRAWSGHTPAVVPH
jgi:hypothetical protein